MKRPLINVERLLDSIRSGLSLLALGLLLTLGLLVIELIAPSLGVIK